MPTRWHLSSLIFPNALQNKFSWPHCSEEENKAQDTQATRGPITSHRRSEKAKQPPRVGIFTRKLRYAAFCRPHKTEHSLSPNTPMLLFQVAVWGWQARTPEESSRLLCGEHGVSRPTGARQAFSAQNSSPKVLTVATTQNVALASWSNNYFASF